MKNKKGFTLVELLGSLVLLGLIFALVIPNILEELNVSKQKISDYERKSIEDAANQYMMDVVGGLESYNSLSGYDFVKDMKDNKTIIISIEDLVSRKYINEKCNYTTNSADCEFSSECEITATLSENLNSNGYYEVTSYNSIADTEKCVKND